MTHSKTTLPSKQCAQCERPFTWRKKWQKDWEYVKYCSRRCRSNAKAAHHKRHSRII